MSCTRSLRQPSVQTARRSEVTAYASYPAIPAIHDAPSPPMTKAAVE